VLSQVVARGVQELKVEIHQIAKELELIHRDEAALQSISEFLQQRLLQSSEDLDTTERELGAHMCSQTYVRVSLCTFVCMFTPSCMHFGCMNTLVRLQ